MTRTSQRLVSPEAGGSTNSSGRSQATAGKRTSGVVGSGGSGAPVSLDGAQLNGDAAGGTRTPTSVRSIAPEAIVSTNSTTAARTLNVAGQMGPARAVTSGLHANMRSLLMRSPEEVRMVMSLAATGKSSSTIARETGIPRSTVREWLAGRLPNGAAGDAAVCPGCGAAEHRYDELPPEYVYLLGLYLGDGCISAHPRRVFRLRLFFDARYPRIIDAGEAAVRSVLPANRINRLSRSGGYENSAPRSNVELSVYSKALPCLFPQHGPGRKHERQIGLEEWQRGLVAKHPEQLLRGLIHSDGCRFINTGRNWRHPRYSFSNRSDDIRAIFCDACDLIGARWTSAPHTYVSRVRDVALLDQFIGPKR